EIGGQLGVGPSHQEDDAIVGRVETGQSAAQLELAGHGDHGERAGRTGVDVASLAAAVEGEQVALVGLSGREDLDELVVDVARLELGDAPSGDVHGSVVFPGEG